MSVKTSQLFSNFGMYKIDKVLDLKLPEININFHKTPQNDFSYYRKDSQNNIIEKKIKSNGSLEIFLCPILPLNLPAKKTNDLIFLRFDKQIIVPPNSNSEIKIQFPIEIGIFVKFENSLDMIDVVTCEPMHSRFALYGTPETGKLCMYSKVYQIDDKNSSPYAWAIMKIIIKNELDTASKIGRLVFSLASHQVYYKHESSESHIDDLEARIFSNIAGEQIELKQLDFSKKSDKWDLSPPKASPSTSFVMNKGFD